MNEFKAVTTAIVLGASMIAGLVVNEVAGTSVDTGAPYTTSFMYCAAWTGVGGTRHCSLYQSGHETRIDTKVTGLFFDTTSYRVVR